MKDAISVLHILSSDDMFGSAKAFMELVVREKNDSRVNPVVILPRKNQLYDFCNLNEIKCYVLKYEQFQVPKHNRWPIFLVKFFGCLIRYFLLNKKAILEGERIVRAERIGLIHTNSSVIDLGARIAKITGLKHVWHIREFGRLDFNFYPLYSQYIKKMNELTSTFIMISNSVKNEWIKKGLDHNKCAVVYDGVDAAQFAFHVAHSFPIKIVMIGSFCEAKGQAIVVDALYMLSQRRNIQVEMHFYGNDCSNYGKMVKRKVNKYGLDKIVTFHGYSSRMYDELPKYDIGLICSRSEGFGRATVEYMLSGLCVVASDSGANPEIIPNGCGTIYGKFDDAIDLASSLEKLLTNVELIKEYAEAGTALARERYDIEKNYEKILCLLIECLRTHS